MLCGFQGHRVVDGDGAGQFVISHRDSQVAKDIYTLAAKLSGAGEGAGAAATPQKAAPKQGLRLFGAR